MWVKNFCWVEWVARVYKISAWIRKFFGWVCVGLKFAVGLEFGVDWRGSKFYGGENKI